ETKDRRWICDAHLDGAASAFSALAWAGSDDLDSAGRVKPEDQSPNDRNVQCKRKDQAGAQSATAPHATDIVMRRMVHCFFSVGSVTRLTSAPACLAMSRT